MAYENMTFDYILNRMLDRVSNSVDKREGSVIYDALAPAAIELANLYIEFDNILNETFADTSSRYYLILRAQERGIVPEEATNAILQAEFTPNTLDIDIGTRFNGDDLNYEVIEKISNGVYKIKSETAGTVGNEYFGTIIPINYIKGLETANITELLIPGEDEESTESLRNRYFETFDTKAFGGNCKDYIQKTNAIAGVGATKVTPAWNGGGTVLLTIINSQYNKASNTLVETVQETIDPTQDGSGVGIAPIGHIVTVRTVDEVTINISTSITFDEGYSFERLETQINETIEDYLKSIREEWANQANSIVRIAQIETRILQLQGVLDIANTSINGSESNLTLTNYEIPVLGVISNGA